MDDEAVNRGQDDVVGFGSGRRRRNWPVWPVWLLVAVVAATVLVVRLSSHQASHPRHQLPRQPAAVTNLHHRLLGVTARWELLGWGPDVVVRIQFARGRIIRTPIPGLASTGHVSFVVTPDLAIIRPDDFVAGYEVPDGGPARRLPGVLDHRGPVVPGPDPAQVWTVASGIRHAELSLVGLDGQPAGASIQLPANGPPAITAISDGRGYVLLTGSHGVYDTGPSGLRWVAASMVAVGPTRWLAVTCRRPHHCRNEVIDTARGQRQILPGRAVEGPAWPPGVISPDGSTAAVFTIGNDGKIRLHLVSLDSGASHAISVPLGRASLEGQTLAWSPDGRWLFVVAAYGRLLAIDPRTGRARSLGAPLPPVAQIGVRNVPS